MTTLDLIYDPLPSDALARFVEDGVIAHVVAATQVSDWHPANFFLRSQRGEWLGGLLGDVWAGWLHVKFLWVSESERGKGQGTRLMEAAEDFARGHGAHRVTLETHTAAGFYRKRGYVVFGRLEDYPPGQTKFYLRKDLAAPS
jgi:ribosomal protein S18 acetylase RimI-like enzyme